MATYWILTKVPGRPQNETLFRPVIAEGGGIWETDDLAEAHGKLAELARTMPFDLLQGVALLPMAMDVTLAGPCDCDCECEEDDCGCECGEVIGPGTPPHTGSGSGVYIHVQDTPAATWVIPHNLGRADVFVLLTDETGQRCETDMEYTSENVLTVFFPRPMTGRAVITLK
jgi:hypothetical protein